MNQFKNLLWSNMHRKLAEHRKCCMQNNQIPSKTLVELTDNSVVWHSYAYVNELFSNIWMLQYMRCVHCGSSISWWFIDKFVSCLWLSYLGTVYWWATATASNAGPAMSCRIHPQCHEIVCVTAICFKSASIEVSNASIMHAFLFQYM